MDHNRHWIGTWATAPASSEAGVSLNNHTVRMHPRVSIGGDTARVRVSNAYGHGKLVIGAAYVGIRDKGPAIVPGSERQLTFGGSESATVAAGALVLSDAVTLDVPPLADLAVTLYLPGEIPPGFQITGRYARQTNYISPPGNFAAAIQMPVGKITDEWFFVSGIDVLASPETGGVVALGDSLTDANISTHDAYCRWPDQLARRLIARQGGRPLGVMNQGLGGNRILHDLRGDSGLRPVWCDPPARPRAGPRGVPLRTPRTREPHPPAPAEGAAPPKIAGLPPNATPGPAPGGQ